MLEVHDLHAFYGKSHILQGVDLSVGDGEIVSLLGRNGVGRSTTCKAIMGLVEPVGTVRYRGRDIAGLGCAHEWSRAGAEHRVVASIELCAIWLLLLQLSIHIGALGQESLDYVETGQFIIDFLWRGTVRSGHGMEIDG